LPVLLQWFIRDRVIPLDQMRMMRGCERRNLDQLTNSQALPLYSQAEDARSARGEWPRQ